MKSIKVDYQRKIEQRKIGDKLYVLEVIRDLDEAIDTICNAMTEEDKKDPFAEDLCPYFGILWPSAEALADFMAKNPQYFKNLSVLELGCGLGLPSLVASHLGANVLATDFHPDVEEYFKRNLRHSNIECEYIRLNWRDEDLLREKFDVVMGSDVLYEGKHPQEVAQGLIRFLKPNGKIILSDPGRNYLQPFLTAIKSEGFIEEMHLISVKEKEIFVFVFERSTKCIV
jgi:predicted nicotinamide N-methyase